MTCYSHVRRKHKSDCRIMAAELFSGIGEMRHSMMIKAPWPMTEFRQRERLPREATRLSAVSCGSTLVWPRCRLCMGSDATVWVFTQGFMPLGDGLVRERHETDHFKCVTQLKRTGPVTTTLGV
jgi:hypothetical protein